MNPTGGWQKLSTQRYIHCDRSPVGVAKSTCCQFEWKIVDFCSLNGNCIFSEYLQFHSISWRMQMAWCANSNGRRRNISIALQKKPSSTANPNVGAIIGFKRPNGSIFGAIRKVLEIPTDPSYEYGSGSHIDSFLFSEWKNINVPNDGLAVVCYLNFAATASDTTWPLGSDCVLVKDSDLFQCERYLDVTMRVKGRQFKAHRSILVAQSAVFAKMFQHDMTEKTKGEVDIEDCDPDSFRDFLVYMYTGETDHVTSDNARGLYITADKYSVEALKENCSKCLSLNLSIDSTCDVLVLATMHNDSKLLESATDFFVNNVKNILQTPNWLKFQSKNCNLVHELFLKAADYIKV